MGREEQTYSFIIWKLEVCTIRLSTCTLKKKYTKTHKAFYKDE